MTHARTRGGVFVAVGVWFSSLSVLVVSSLCLRHLVNMYDMDIFSLLALDP